METIICSKDYGKRKKLSKPQQKVIDFLRANPNGYIVHDPEYQYGQYAKDGIINKKSFFFNRQTFDSLLKMELIKDEGFMNRFILS